MNMKRFIVLLLCLAALQAFANPLVAPPNAVISELYFNAGGKWFLEVEFFEPVDTVWIQTNSGEAYYLSSGDYSQNRFVVLTCDSLNNPSLAITKKNDCIKVITKSDPTDTYYSGMDSMLIGVQSGSVIDSIPPGCSINKNWWNRMLCLDCSPTLGESNDEVGTTATIYGHFYQLGPDFQSYDEKYFCFSDQVTMSTDLWAVGFPINKNCDYAAKVGAKRYSINNLVIFTYSINAVYWMDFIKNDFVVYPGDSVRVDFTMGTSLKVPAGQNTLFSNYPNPANDKTSFVLNMPLMKLDEVFIRLYSLDGKLVQTLQPKSGIYDFDCSGMKPGTYICKMEHSGVTVASTKLLIVR
jgi:hypothetical protein